MPHAIAFAAFQAGVPLGVVNAIAGVGVAGAVVHAGVGLGFAVGASWLAGRVLLPQVPKNPVEGQFEFQQPIPVRFWPYGRVRLSGPLALMRSESPSVNVVDKQLVKITMLGTRELDAIEEFYLNDDLLTLDGSLKFIGYLSGGNNHIEAQAHLGSSTQAADATLLAGLTGWSSNHRLRGIPYVVTYQGVSDPEAYQEVYGGWGHKEARATVRGVKVYDPRKDSTNGGSGSHRTGDPSTWEWSDNVTLCALDYTTHADGRGKPWAQIDWASWVAAANIDDEAVALKAGGTEKRYRLATLVHLDEAKKDVMARILSARDGRLFKTSTGLIGMRGGAWQSATVGFDLDDPDTCKSAEFTQGVPLMQRVNEFELRAMLPTHDYKEVELEPVANGSDIDYLAGRIFRQPLNLTQVPSNGQAQRLAKIVMARLNPRWSGEIRLNLSGLNAIGEEVLGLAWGQLESPADNFDGPFWVNGPISIDSTGVTIPVISADATAYSWSAASEEQDAPPVPTG